MLTVMAGSAHSKIENSIPSGEEHRLRYMRPFVRDLFDKLIADKDSVRAPLRRQAHTRGSDTAGSHRASS
jgi:hypothetical protein